MRFTDTARREISVFLEKLDTLDKVAVALEIRKPTLHNRLRDVAWRAWLDALGNNDRERLDFAIDAVFEPIFGEVWMIGRELTKEQTP